ncbi:MAG: hypothetical protein IJ693_05380 [Bacteroidaceae bacterium]|nr:hypothetical protein [Bacteroidaceae bacterium]
MSKDYFQSQEFKDLLKSYETGKDKRKSIYLDADDFADIADYYLNIDKPERAMEAIGMGLSIHPEEEVLLIVQSAAYIYQREFDKAQDIVVKLDSVHNSDVKYQVAQLEYAKYGNVESAEEIWRIWMEMENGDNPSEELKRESYIHIISSMAELRNRDEMDDKEKDCLYRWIKEYIDKFQPLGKYEEDVQLADICRESELADLMCEVLSQVLEEQPYLPKGWSNLALAQYLLQRYDQALESCDFALAVNPDDLDSLLTKAHSLHAMGERSLSKPIFKEYLDKGGEPVQAIPYVEALFLDGEKDKAMQELNWLSSCFEENRTEMEERWEAAQKRKLSARERQEEQSLYEDFIDLYKKIYTDISDLYHHNECFEESLHANEKILEVDPTCAEAFFMVGINYLALRSYEDAARYFALALQYADDQVMMGLDIALTFVLNDFDKFALEVLNAVSRIADGSRSPFVKNIPAAKSLTYLKIGQTDQFLKNFKIACKETPDLIRKVYEGYFPKNMPVGQWSDYAEREVDTLMKNFKKGNLYIAGLS